jgi:DNA-binding protein YbaB
VGGFQYEENAQKKVKDLQEQGYNAQIIGQNSKGLYIVAVDGGNDLSELTKKLPEFFEVEPKAWVYKSK